VDSLRRISKQHKQEKNSQKKNVIFCNSLGNNILAKGKTATKTAKKQILVLFRDWSASVARTSDYHEPGYHRFYMNSTMFRISREGDIHMCSCLKCTTYLYHMHMLKPIQRCTDYLILKFLLLT